MRKIILSLIFSIFMLQVSAQKVYYIYLQTESDQPFFVRLNEKVHSSSASGYLILSKMRDSTYTFIIGFPGNKWPEQKYSTTIGGKDHGYILKNFADKGWGLFDLQNFSVQMPATNEKKLERQSPKTDVSKFTEILAKAVDDSTLMQRPIQPKAEEKKTEVAVVAVEKKEDTKISDSLPQETKPVEKKSEVILNPEENKSGKESIVAKETPAPGVIETDTVKSNGYKKSAVSRKSESSTTEGFGLIFIDQYEDGTIDTISIVIPNLRPEMKEIKEEPVEEKKIMEIKPVAVKLPDTIVKAEIKDTAGHTLIKEKQQEATPDKPDLKNKCSVTADETDFLDLRKNMASAMNNDGMIEEAKKYFKLKCFSTMQIRNLGFLFLNEEGKYRFFDNAYSAVSDIEKFGTLQSELKEEYYINRFKAMLRN